MDGFADSLGDRCKALSEKKGTEKGREFEVLLAQWLPRIPETELEEVWRWSDAPSALRERISPRTKRADTGIDLVAKRRDGGLVAIQAKCYGPDQKVEASELGTSALTTGNAALAGKWLVTTGGWTRNLERSASDWTLIHAPTHWSHVVLQDKRPRKSLDAQQREAFDAAVKGLEAHDRGTLVMACGTGKTLTSQRVAERLVPNGGLVLYATPSIGLTAQSRREWLREAGRPLHTVVVCSDIGAGTGWSNEVEAPVTTDPETIARAVKKAGQAAGSEGLVAVFSTYQSMEKLCLAQEEHGLPGIDLMIADEAHRTTGVVKDDDPKAFQMAHHRLRARKRLYQTATPRIFSRRSQKKIIDGIATETESRVDIHDMDDVSTYGPELHRLTFSEALQAPEEERRLSDYRVVVFFVSDMAGGAEAAGRQAVEKLKDTSLAERIAGLGRLMLTGEGGNEPNELSNVRSCIAYCNKLVNAKEAKNILQDKEGGIRKWAARMAEQDGKRLGPEVRLDAGYLDGNSDTAERIRELDNLAKASVSRRRVTTNVKVLSEGIDVPALDAICFLEERKGEIDIVQAVGRVMRKPPGGGKECGYVVVPVVASAQLDLELNLSEWWNKDWRVLGQVLRALRAHDARIETDLEKLLIVTSDHGGKDGRDGDDQDDDRGDFWSKLKEGIFDALVPVIMEKSGINPDGSERINLIKQAVTSAATQIRRESGLGARLASAVGVEEETGDPEKRACGAAALIIANALLMHQRIDETRKDERRLRVTPLREVKSLRDPEKILLSDWKRILELDYRVIFEPAIRVIRNSGGGGGGENGIPEGMRHALQTLAKHCGEIASQYAEMGMDHAGELFQAAMDNAAADGAYYTLSPGAMLLAELACDAKADEGDSLWADPDTWVRECVLDPACGSGTLLTAFASAVRRRAAALLTDDGCLAKIGKALVEDGLAGLDINERALQIAGTQLAIGASDIGLLRMGLWAMPRKVSGAEKITAATVRLGALELLSTLRDGAIRTDDLFKGTKEANETEGIRIDIAEDAEHGGMRKHLSRTTVCISNPPYSNSAKEGQNLNPAVRKAMQERKSDMRAAVAGHRPELAPILNPNSVRPWFSVLMEEMVDPDRGVVAMVMPTTACTAADPSERKFWSRNFDVLYIVTLHNPKTLNWSVSTGITESMMIARRRNGGERPKTRFVSLARRPETVDDVLELRDGIRSEDLGDWGRICLWPSKRMENGDWSPAVWYHPALAEAGYLFDSLAEKDGWTRLGELGAIRTTKEIVGKEKWEWCEPDFAEVPVTKGAGSDAQTCLSGRIDDHARRAIDFRDDPNTWKRLTEKVGYFHVANTQCSVSARVNSIALEQPAVGYTWTPVQEASKEEAQALSVWLNSSLGRILMRRIWTRKLNWPMYQPDALENWRYRTIKRNLGAMP